jgi:hypothetical protein
MMVIMWATLTAQTLAVPMDLRMERTTGSWKVNKMVDSSVPPMEKMLAIEWGQQRGPSTVPWRE